MNRKSHMTSEIPMKAMSRFAVAVLCFGAIGAKSESVFGQPQIRLETWNRIKSIPRNSDPATLPNDETRYLFALSLLEPHLLWRASHVVEPTTHLYDEIRQSQVDTMTPWQEAHRGDALLLSAKQREKLEAKLGIPKTRLGTSRPFCFWRLNKSRNSDVLHAIRILKRIQLKRLVTDAKRWVSELERNNTVITFDIPGACFRGKEAPLVVDVRNADQMRCKLYRVESLELLTWLFSAPTYANHLGHDFVYRDFGLQFKSREQRRMIEELERATRLAQRNVKLTPMPKLPPDRLLHEWNVDVSSLRRLDSWQRRHGSRDSNRWTGQPDSDTFEDSCTELKRRLDYEYIATDGDPDSPRFTSWHCNRILAIPGQYLKNTGAYVLVAEANGQRSYAPLLVDPLSMTLRRCRDGVLAAVSSANGKQPVAGADVIAASPQHSAAKTDKNGVAFSRTHGMGTTAILAHKNDQFAVGGFGRVFEAIYFPKSRFDQHERVIQKGMEATGRLQELSPGFVYADQFLAAAWTDRPIYRPGHTVHFKLLLRRLESNLNQPKDSDRFRANDFDVSRELVVPKTGTTVRYALLDPRGRVVANGHLETNDFGTVAGRISTNSAAALGEYALRVRVHEVDRIIPNVFLLDHYRRDRFLLEIEGLPKQLPSKPNQVAFSLRGKFSFGTAAAGLSASCHIEADNGEHVSQPFSGTLDTRGQLKVNLRCRQPFGDGAYMVVCLARDLSGRTVATRQALRVGVPQTTSPLAELPVFARVGDKLAVKSLMQAVHVQDSTGKTKVIEPDADGQVLLTSASPGWLHVQMQQHSKRVFFHSEKDDPPLHKKTRRLAPGWVNLSDFEDHGLFASRHEFHQSRGPSVLALFDRQRVSVGDELLLHVFVPAVSPGTRVLLTYEGRTVVDYHIVELTRSGYQTIRLPIRPRHVPNFYLQASVINPGFAFRRPAYETFDVADELKETEAGDPKWCRIDVIDPVGRRKTAGLKIQVTTDKAEYQPGDEASASVRVTDEFGEPVEAEVSLAVVDEMVFAHAQSREDRVARAFTAVRPSRRYRDKAWRTSHGDNWSLARLNYQSSVKYMSKQIERLAQQAARSQAESIESLKSLEALQTPVQAGSWLAWANHGALPIRETPIPQSRRRMDFGETAAWRPRMRTDERGKASVSFKLPDSLTTYRLTAVGVTKDSRIGTNREGSIQADLPLSVQIQTPRFAVAGDQLRLTGVLRNQTRQQRTVQYKWHITGANPHNNDGLGGSVMIEPASETAVFAEVKVPRAGNVTARLLVSDREHADEEQRQFTVQPFGRARQVHLHGLAKDGEQVRWPPGFLAEKLTVSLSRGQELTESLAGLEYLIAYPYGCVEQTMSRFLPAVVVHRAARKHGVALPDSIHTLLPAVLKRGMTRLYALQHEDGGWGWWEADKTDHRMTIYVLYGFVRCQDVQVEVDKAVIRNGLNYLSQELTAGRIDRSLQSRAWLVLALSGRANKAALTSAATGQLLTRRDHCNFALAAEALGLKELSVAQLNRIQRWDCADSIDLALQLQTLLRIDNNLDRVTEIAVRLAKNRRGVRWGDTRSTSAAIEAMSEYLTRIPPTKTKSPATKSKSFAEATTLLGDVAILSTQDGSNARPKFSQATGTNQVAFSRTVDRKLLGVESTPPISFKVDGQSPVYFSASAQGVQLAEKLERFGSAIRIQRQYLSQPKAHESRLGTPLSSVVNGDTLQVELVLELDKAAEYVLLEDPHPAGCEFAIRRILGTARDHVSHIEFRDDRVCLFFARLPAGTHRIAYELRADTPGTFRSLPAAAYPMYRENLWAESASSHLRIRPAG